MLIATHRNTDHIHNHIILNSVNMETGKKFHQSAAEMRQVKEYSNKLCREYGLSETETKSSFKSMPKWKSQLRNKAYSVANRTRSKEDFIFEMEMHGYKVDWQEGHKYITFTTPDGHKCRDNMSTTADIYSHLDANATGEAGMKLGKLLADGESEVS